jgi:hypothetical protein
MFSRAVIFLALALSTGVSGLVPHSRALPSAAQRARVLVGVDANVIAGVGVGLAGLLSGVGLMAFQENQVARAEERGSDVVSEATKTKLSAQFMEDVEMNALGLDDTVSKMERALAKRKGMSVDAAIGEIDKKEVLDDGW